jgi:5-methylcytosine-specific restriction endonuclease McrA
MNLKHLTDGQLQLDIKNLVQNERSLLTQILYHLKEIEARKLFSSFGYSSLFEYACQELKYSSDQAFRRIQAMRLLKEIPEAAQKIDSGELSLSNINQAQKYFKQANVVSKFEKNVVLQKLCHKSVRDAQKEILKLSPLNELPVESKKQVAPDLVHVSFNMSDQLESKLENFKALLGPKSYGLSTAQLIETITDLALIKLQEKKFGKKLSTLNVQSENQKSENQKSGIQQGVMQQSVDQQLEIQRNNVQRSEDRFLVPKQQPVHSFRPYISKQLKFKVWHKDKYKCKKCSSQTNLQIDHIMPLAVGGPTCAENLRLLCFNCNQRSRIEAKL